LINLFKEENNMKEAKKEDLKLNMKDVLFIIGLLIAFIIYRKVDIVNKYVNEYIDFMNEMFNYAWNFLFN
jgi:hypothetical protein